MAKNFIYTARNRAGQLLTGTVLAEDQTAAASYVRQQDCFITLIAEDKPKSSTGQFLKRLRRVGTKDLAVFCRQFSTMINAGIPILSCLGILMEQCESSLLKETLQDVYKRVREGEALSRTLASYPHVFPRLMISLVEAGELGGVMEEVFERLAAQFEKEHKLNEKVKSATVYPLVVMGIACLIVIFILVFVLPTFVGMFEGMRVELPLPTRMLLLLSSILQNQFLLLAALAAAAVYGIRLALRQPEIRERFDAGILRLPVVGVLTRKIEIARFSRTLSTLLRGGVDIIVALEVVEKILSNSSMARALVQAKSGIREGKGLAPALNSSKVFTPMTVQMIAIGEESGSLDQMLERVADFYDNEVDDMVARLNSLLEPFIILFLGITIGSIVVAILLPMFDVMSGMGTV
ncbi:type II secretion system F family protein|uniref:Type IV pilus assembly protein PilC n=1 Tax=Dendrosporobacter quercicolus TaxID=146817 RepID=A0A1G9M8C7_9FIRM|nr:type II secretion system F family protein [Dendrosporobacter quercicolus]NSL46954.1 type II secretion system F family protein [Dendrosporobacter quercicolus DSM 1736]SDL70363.1 type IV pilus assembly protein PilC [Dendrosporobacter quercicolus]